MTANRARVRTQKRSPTLYPTELWAHAPSAQTTADTTTSAAARPETIPVERRTSGANRRRGPYSGLRFERKACPECGRSFGPAAGDGWPSWGRRKACSIRCGVRSRFKDTTPALYERVTDKGRPIRTHRAVMEAVLGRRLERAEIVHHKNGDKLDNRPENLEVMSQSEHAALHFRKYPAFGNCERCAGEFKRNGRKNMRFCSNRCAAFARWARKRGAA